MYFHPATVVGILDRLEGRDLVTRTRSKAHGRSHASIRGRHRHDNTGLHIVALFEAAKGAVVILAGLGLLELIHRDVQAVTENIVRHLHPNQVRRSLWFMAKPSLGRVVRYFIRQPVSSGRNV